MHTSHHLIADADRPIQTRYLQGEITRLHKAAEETARASLDAIAGIPPDRRTFETTFLAFDHALAEYADAVCPFMLMGSVYPDAKIAAEGMASEEAVSVFMTQVYTRRDLYDTLRGQAPRTRDEARLRDVTLREFEKHGLKLPEDRLAHVREMRTRLSGLETRYSANLNNDTTTIECTAADLAGVPAATTAGCSQTAAGTCLVTTKYPDYIAVMTHAHDAGTRRKMYAAYHNRQAEANTPLLEEAIVLRDEIARELGYATWADYQIEGRMAERTGRVTAFLTALQAPLKKKYADEMTGLLVVKRRLDPAATAVDPWDLAYLQEVWRHEEYAYDEEKVREFFPVETVLQGLFKTVGTLFGIGFSEVEDAPVWAPEVRLYAVEDLGGTETETLGYLYLDLYPREGKYGHFCTAPLVGGRSEEGVYSTPVVAIIGNFHAPEKDRPALLTMYEIETLFHETGHALHHLLTTAPYATLSGFDVEFDFVETPSQALEEWAWDPAVLDAVSGHYTDQSRKIPPDLRDRVIAARTVGEGSAYTRLLVNSLEDLRFHTDPAPVDVTEVWALTYEEVTGTRPLPGTHQPASFGHLMGGYDAGYYGYLWSKVYALDIVEVFEEIGMTDQATGTRFRDEILSRGNMEDGMVLLRNFLGRDPGPGALYRRLGIEVPQEDARISPGA
ncbi:thimet oligopeptidase [Methanofollis sp. W23]|uniref:M3 family metallopeptidase n=1 Tax=Methanofollis sp. W23 TaxID=2817849 RepID=UPI001AE30800|nr:M3 family metallopeptidase [Methanofollis sp. W23]MBP2145112.1 thimet oligopeptidase [Methanofollis sp. W23]